MILSNITTIPDKLMAYWLRSRGWVCFYLREEARQCNGICWMNLYNIEEESGRSRDK